MNSILEISSSVVINTLNEEDNIEACIRSIQSFAREIIVCDMHSDDRTVEIAQSLGARIVYHERTGYVEPARYYAISQAQHDWVLVLDADERMTDFLAQRLQEIAQQNNVDLVLFGVLYNYFGGYVRYGGFYQTNFPRFFRRTTYLQTYQASETLVHQNFRELERADIPRIQLPGEYYILHEAYPTVEKYIYKTIGMYARLEAEQRVSKGERFVAWRMMAEPIREFLRKFLGRQGYRDGWRGFILATLYAVFRFAVWANIWFLQGTQKQTVVSHPSDQR